MTKRVINAEPRRSPFHFTEEQIEFCKVRYQNTSGEQVRQEFNKTFGTDITVWQIHKLNHKYQWRKSFEIHRPKIIWTDEAVQYCKDHAKEYTYRGMANKLNEVFGTSYTEEQVGSLYSRFKITNDKPTAFKKGHIPMNKGKKWDDYLSKEQQESLRKTCFKKGNVPYSWKPVGTTIIRKKSHTESGKYRAIKLENGKWIAYAKYVMEQSGVKVGKDEYVIHLDGDTLNDALDNLMVISRSECSTLNKKYKVSKNPELTKAAILTVRLNNAVKTKKEEEDGKVGV